MDRCLINVNGRARKNHSKSGGQKGYPEEKEQCFSNLTSRSIRFYSMRVLGDKKGVTSNNGNTTPENATSLSSTVCSRNEQQEENRKSHGNEDVSYFHLDSFLDLRTSGQFHAH